VNRQLRIMATWTISLLKRMNMASLDLGPENHQCISSFKGLNLWTRTSTTNIPSFYRKWEQMIHNCIVGL
jgi:hypothetical protein